MKIQNAKNLHSALTFLLLMTNSNELSAKVRENVNFVIGNFLTCNLQKIDGSLNKKRKIRRWIPKRV